MKIPHQQWKYVIEFSNLFLFNHIVSILFSRETEWLCLSGGEQLTGVFARITSCILACSTWHRDTPRRISGRCVKVSSMLFFLYKIHSWNFPSLWNRHTFRQRKTSKWNSFGNTYLHEKTEIGRTQERENLLSKKEDFSLNRDLFPQKLQINSHDFNSTVYSLIYSILKIIMNLVSNFLTHFLFFLSSLVNYCSLKRSSFNLVVFPF